MKIKNSVKKRKELTNNPTKRENGLRVHSRLLPRQILNQLPRQLRQLQAQDRHMEWRRCAREPLP